MWFWIYQESCSSNAHSVIRNLACTVTTMWYRERIYNYSLKERWWEYLNESSFITESKTGRCLNALSVGKHKLRWHSDWILKSIWCSDNYIGVTYCTLLLVTDQWSQSNIYITCMWPGYWNESVIQTSVILVSFI